MCSSVSGIAEYFNGDATLKLILYGLWKFYYDSKNNLPFFVIYTSKPISLFLMGKQIKMGNWPIRIYKQYIVIAII